ncbi:unnamed protein product [Effrenium voratum]|uniref:Kinesin-like protein n=1 Tax=Effrenium voratum TaxID=2562239 RepID=A0AA36JF00_9DINO|nr:unnamed protein product [Effrenium voratum]
MDASASPVVPLPAVPAVRLVVRTLGGDVLAEPQVELSWSVWELKRALFSAGAPAIARQKLLLEERPLADSETLAAAGLSDGAQLLCLCVPTPDGKNMVQAVVRCRSMSEEEVARGCRRVLTLDPATNSARLHKDEEENSFSFYKVLEQHSELDELGQKLVQNVVEGYSSTVFAFGTTGSGKSSSLWGEKEEEGLALAWGRQLLEPRSARLQPRGARFCCSLLEIRSSTTDLLAEADSAVVQLRAEKGADGSSVVAKDVTSVEVKTLEEMKVVLGFGLRRSTQRRKEFPGPYGDADLIFSLTVETVEEGQPCIRSLQFAECRGAGRVVSAGCARCMKEAASYAAAQSSMMQVVHSLASPRRGPHVPYRNSRLAFLLKDSLGGPTKTLWLSHVTPTDADYKETLSTLRYTSNVGRIENPPLVMRRGPVPDAVPLQVVVRTMGGEVLAEPQVDLRWPVRELKQLLWAAGAPTLGRQKLLLEEQQLEDSRTLAESGVSDGAHLLCLCVPAEEDGKNFVRAAVRCRPMSKEELANGCSRVLTMDTAAGSLRLQRADRQEAKSFTFHKVFDESCGQQQLFNELGPDLVQCILEGHDATVIAMGTTGSGKSASLWGDETNRAGLASLCGRHLLAAAQRSGRSWRVSGSWLDIFCVEVFDLLAEADSFLELSEIHGATVAEGATAVEVKNPEELQAHRAAREAARGSATPLYSDRVFALTVETLDAAGKNTEFIRRLLFVECKGSERMQKVGKHTHKEAISYSSLLPAIGNVVSSLAEARPGTYVPYRDSKLTLLLKQSLGGPTKTLWLSHVTPTDLAYEESLSTVRYAARAARIENPPLARGSWPPVAPIALAAAPWITDPPSGGYHAE